MLDSLMISIPEYFASLKFSALMRALPGGIAQGLIWGILALGVFMTFRMLGISDLTVDGSMATGGAVCIMLVLKGVNPQLALLASFLGTGVSYYAMWALAAVVFALAVYYTVKQL